MTTTLLRKYGTAATIDFILRDTGGLNLKIDAVFASGDVKLMKDEGAEASATNGFTDEGQGYSLALTAVEMQAARLVVYVVDQGSKAWQDAVVLIETYGHASAQFPIDPADIKSKTDLISAARITPLNAIDATTQALTLYQGDTPTIAFTGLDAGLLAAAAVTLAIVRAGSSEVALVSLDGTVLSDTSLSVEFEAGWDDDLEIGVEYEYDIHLTLSGGASFSPIRRSPLYLLDNIDRA